MNQIFNLNFIAVKIDPDALRRHLESHYELSDAVFKIHTETLRLCSVADSYALLDRISPDTFVKDEQMPYWAEIWPASFFLGEYLLKELKPVGKRIIEIGAGVGLLGLCAAKSGASVLMTDYAVEALDFMSLNAVMNGVQCPEQVDMCVLDWRNISLTETFDYLIAADVLYERRNLLPILLAIEKLVKPEGKAFIADPHREVAKQFLSLACDYGFHVETISSVVTTPTGPLTIDIYQLSRLTARRH